MKPTKELAMELMQEVKEKYPHLKKVKIDYNGAGDNFDSFYDSSAEFAETTDDAEEQLILDFIQEKFENIMFEVLDEVGADFNNDGCRGTIYFNFETISIGADLYEYHTECSWAGKTDFIGELEESDTE